MAFEVPTSLIREAQIALRNEAGLSSYDPDDTSIPKLPSLDETIAGLDTSPPYLRCQQCRGRLLRGLQSMICVYCGAQQRRELLPEPISFKSTFGYRWLLESMDLDGSEVVESANESNDSNKGRSASKKELRLSDLLDLELTWPAETEKSESSNTNKAPIQSSSLNLAGVDLDSFFSETKKEAMLSVSEDQLILDKHIKSTESQAFHEQSFALFENFHSSEFAMRSTEGETGDTFSGWEDELQSASSGTHHDDSKPLDPFQGSTVDLCSHVDVGFSSNKDVKDIDRKSNDGSVPLGSTSDNWLQEDQWHTSITSVSEKTEQFDVNIKANEGEQKNNVMNNSSMSDNWFKDNIWQTSASNVPNNEKINEIDESYDAWQDFTSSRNTEDPSQFSWKQTGAPATPTNEQASEMILVSLNNGSKGVDFGSNLHTDIFSGVSSHQNDSTILINTQAEASGLNRIAGVNVKTERDALQSPENDKGFNATLHSESDDFNVETLMSQMHDLSFMLDSKLSIPLNVDDDNNSIL